MQNKPQGFDYIIGCIMDELRIAPLIHPPRWQSIDVSDKPHMATHEVLNYSFSWDCSVAPTVNDLQLQIKPNLPWAEDHFKKERVGGDPLNPGQEWKNWPYAKSADTHRREGVFDHSYAERYWPRYANMTEGGVLGSDEPDLAQHNGIRFPYGDLNNLVNLLSGEPLTRQAYLPVWFPEDLCAADLGKRVPCSLGYHFIMRNDRLHVVYYIRSCDFIRHFRDDVYMTVRLLQWVLAECKLLDPEKWDGIGLGSLTMHITSLHIFKADYKGLFRHETDARQ